VGSNHGVFMSNDDLILDRKTGQLMEQDEYKETKKRRKRAKAANKFVQFYYEEQLKLAKLTRNCLLAVLAELHHLHWKSWDKSNPIELENKVIQSLGFDNKQKKVALERLEAAGWIKVEWRKNQSTLGNPYFRVQVLRH
jgi:hypothetical protein